MIYIVLLFIATIMTFYFRSQLVIYLWNYSYGKFEISYLENILSESECNELMELAKERLVPSQVQLENNLKSYEQFRTSSTAHIEKNERLAMKLQEKLSKQLEIEVDKFERVQVTNYKPGEKFKAHFDANLSDELWLSREYTLIVFLNDNFDGGETGFPNLKMEYSPKKGDGIFFQNIFGGRVHPLSLHEGKVLKSGEKWIYNQWMHS